MEPHKEGAFQTLFTDYVVHDFLCARRHRRLWLSLISRSVVAT